MEIREESSSDELHLSLYDAGARVATARASSQVLEQMEASLGLSREQVRGMLDAALTNYAKDALPKVQIGTVRESPEGSTNYVANYVYKDFGDITAGVTDYDMRTGTTGPDEVPAVVRNKLRYAVHELLVRGDPGADALRGALR